MYVRARIRIIYYLMKTFLPAKCNWTGSDAMSFQKYKWTTRAHLPLHNMVVDVSSSINIILIVDWCVPQFLHAVRHWLTYMYIYA